jgi:hypothetical protein
MFDLSQMAINEYNQSLLFSSCASVDPQVSPGHGFCAAYNMISIPQDTSNADSGNQTKWAAWQRFLMGSEVLYSIQGNAFGAWPIVLSAP